MNRFILTIYFLLITCLFAIGQNAEQLRTGISVHDPVMIKQDSIYYLFCTGRGISEWSSKDRVHWKQEKPVFDSAPGWAVEAVPGFRNHIWAPDISFHNGLYYLYYSVSAFGKNTSCIGVATNKTLNPSDPNFHWTDHGKLIQSVPGVTNWNAIDPNLTVNNRGEPYLVFGSFWGGIKLAKLSPDRLHVAEDMASISTIASRYNAEKRSGNNAIEAPFIFKKGKYYYLFASIDYCCQGAKSTYKMIVGRSEKMEGPYTDRENIGLASGGGTLLLAGNEDWHGVGHNAVCTFNNNDYLIFHGYDAKDNGRSKLRIEKLDWKKGWPVVSSEK